MKIIVGTFSLFLDGRLIAQSLPATPGVLVSDCGNVVGRLDHETGVATITTGPMARIVASVDVLTSRPPTGRTPLPHGPAQKGRGGKIRKWGRP